MYQNNPNAYNNYYNPHGSPPINTQTPPPLQHPIPQHPIPNFNQAVHHPSASPGLSHQQQQNYQYRQNTQQQQQQQQQQQHQHQQQQGAYTPNMGGPVPPGNMYSQFGFNEPATQLGMQFAGNAVAQGQAYMERNFNRWVDMPALRHYFNVNNLYVVSKLKLILFPWRHSPWSRSIRRTETGQMEGFKPPREDVNSPDLYIPVMAVVTYILLCGLAAGQQGSFHPDKLYVAGWSSLAIIFVELMLTRLGCYFMNIPFEASMLDLIAYSGYKYVCIIVTDVVKLLGVSKWISSAVFIYTALSVSFFLLRSMRYVILPDATAGPSTLNPQRKLRMWFLLSITGVQLLAMFMLVN